MFVPFLYQLMRSCDERQIVEMGELEREGKMSVSDGLMGKTPTTTGSTDLLRHFRCRR